MIDQENDLLTIAEATRLLKVGRTTIHRWLKSGRLRAYHVGPRAVRIRRSDLAAIMKPTLGGGPGEADMVSAMSLQTAIRPLTNEAVERGMAALARSRDLTERMLAQRDGRPFDPSWPMIRTAREQRSEQI